jgi:hypothetical protein
MRESFPESWKPIGDQGCFGAPREVEHEACATVVARKSDHALTQFENKGATMKTASIALFLALLAGEAHAISRYTTTGMDCAEIKAALQSEGAAILQWRSTRDPSLPIYGRYVANRRYCKLEQVADTAFVPARDTKSCLVRKCVNIDLPEGR